MGRAIAVPFTCLTTGTQLHSAELDGARCGDPRHFHVRLANGFAGARPVSIEVSYRDVTPTVAE